MNIKKHIMAAAMIVVLFSAMGTETLNAAAVDYGSEWGGSNHTTQPDYSDEWKGSKEPERVFVQPGKEPIFSDVLAEHWAFEYIQTCSANGWVDGYDDDIFKPENSITRAEAIRVIVSFMNLPMVTVSAPTYSDVDKTAWYFPYVETGKDLLPYRADQQGAGFFKPDVPITREDAVYMVVNVLGYDRYLNTVSYSKINQFTDRSKISKDTEAYMAVAVEYNIISGYNDGTVLPLGHLTRAEFAAILCRTKLLELK